MRDFVYESEESMTFYLDFYPIVVYALMELKQKNNYAELHKELNGYSHLIYPIFII
jgi:hypothetical protein